ncbi:MAG: ABC transporter ATP-binding protein [Rubripirellula sp.]|nr:ABC transporter ATP-binding protein [Rubripirellula sp.]
MNDPSQHASSISCRQLTVRFGGGFEALKSVSLEIPEGEILSLVGPSGCGKTTLLRVLANLQQPTAGEVVLNPAIRGDLGQIAFVFQQPTLLPWRTALQNVVLPLELLRQSNPLGDSSGGSSGGSSGTNAKTRRECEEIAVEMMRQVGLGDALQRYPRQLSGGMKMRVSIARALVTQPKVLLLDEPFAALDEILRDQLGDLLLERWEQQRFTAVMVTHNISESVLLSHRIASIQKGQIKELIENPLPWPRSGNVRGAPGFGDLYRRVSLSLHDDPKQG